MKSAGNDIVALAEVNRERTLQFNFYSKIISISEQELYIQSSLSGMPFENYVWLLWSIKESVYKYLKRNLPTLVFSPTKIVVQNIEILKDQVNNSFDFNNLGSSSSMSEFYAGQVTFGLNVLYFRSKLSDEWICSAVDEYEDFENVNWGVRFIDFKDHSHQSIAVRKLVLEKLSSIISGNLAIGKSEIGYPVILKESEILDVPISLAHHGNFVAYSFLMVNEDCPRIVN